MHYLTSRPKRALNKIKQKYRLIKSSGSLLNYSGKIRGMEITIKQNLIMGNPNGFSRRKSPRYFSLELFHNSEINLGKLDFFMNNFLSKPQFKKIMGNKIKVSSKKLKDFDFYLNLSEYPPEKHQAIIDSVSSMIDDSWAQKILKIRGEGIMYTNYFRGRFTDDRIILDREINSPEDFEALLKFAEFMIKEAKKYQ